MCWDCRLPRNKENSFWPFWVRELRLHKSLMRLAGHQGFEALIQISVVSFPSSIQLESDCISYLNSVFDITKNLLGTKWWMFSIDISAHYVANYFTQIHLNYFPSFYLPKMQYPGISLCANGCFLSPKTITSGLGFTACRQLMLPLSVAMVWPTWCCQGTDDIGIISGSLQ